MIITKESIDDKKTSRKFQRIFVYKNTISRDDTFQLIDILTIYDCSRKFAESLCTKLSKIYNEKTFDVYYFSLYKIDFYTNEIFTDIDSQIEIPF